MVNIVALIESVLSYENVNLYFIERLCDIRCIPEVSLSNALFDTRNDGFSLAKV